MFIFIDGTSSTLSYDESSSDYDRVYRNGFMRRMWRQCTHRNKRYFQGPNILSIMRDSSQGLRLEVFAYIERLATQRHNPDTEIVLAGYSRGGAICISIAREIKRMQEITEYRSWARNLRITNLILLDAVDRAFLYTDVIPSNVPQVFHAIRDESVHSRECFGNTGLQFESQNTQRLIQYFLTSHAGIGGVINAHEYGGASAAPESDYETNYAELAVEMLASLGAEGPLGPPVVLGEEVLVHLIDQILECTSSVDTHNLSLRQDLAGSNRVWNWLQENVMPILTETTGEALAAAAPIPGSSSATLSAATPGLTPSERLGIDSVPQLEPLEFTGDDYVPLASGVLTGLTARTGGIREITGGRLQNQGRASQFEIYGKIRVMPAEIPNKRQYFPRFERQIRTGSNVTLRYIARDNGSGTPEEVSLVLSNYQRAHAWGPGFGDEAKDGIMYAPEAVNQIFQNEGAEEAIRLMANFLATEEFQNKVWLRVVATSFPENLMHGLRINRALHTELLLHTVVYHLGLSAANSDTNIIPYCRIEIEVPHPRDSSQRIETNIIPFVGARILPIDRFFDTN